MLNTSKFHRSFPVEKSINNLGPSINKHVNLSKVRRLPRIYDVHVGIRLYKVACLFIFILLRINPFKSFTVK